MKCPKCGTENQGSQDRCVKCGRSLKAPSSTETRGPDHTVHGSTIQSEQRESIGPVDHREVARKLKFDYAHGHKDQMGKAIDALQSLCANFEKRPVDLVVFMNEIVSIIFKQFGIANVAIGLRDKDGLYRYKVQMGLKPETALAQSKLVYTRKQFTGDSEYKGTEISRYSIIYLEEDMPFAEEEKDTYNRPVLLGSRRLSPVDSLEGDYIDTHIFDGKGDLIGWIEVSGTRTGKIPDVNTIRTIEIMGSILGIVLSCPELAKHL